MSSSEQLLVALLRSDHLKSHLFPHLSTRDICALRESSSACCNLVTKRLFTRIHVSFGAGTFTKATRLAALGRIGHHVEHLTFYLPHSEATFLPPLVHPQTGQEISFLYAPHTSVGSVLTRPKYANTELGDILTQQYPPLFHAATNVPSFIHALKMLPNMRHLTIHCPGQNPRERYRRDVVDYALISLRIAVERAPVEKLVKLSLSSLHASAFNYLRHVPGFGSIPSASRRWKQIKKLNISVESWDFYGPSPGLDHLKVIDDYIRTFSPTLEKLSFTWLGRRGPCPVALAADPLFAPPRNSKKLFHEVTSPNSPLPTPPARSPIHCPKLRHMQVRNATMNVPQLSELIASHRPTVRGFDFENVVLINNGSWEDALAPLGSDDAWSRSSFVAASECSLVTSEASEELPSPSAAVEAASRELMDTDLGGLSFNEDEENNEDYEEILEGLSEDVAAAREASMSFTTKLKKKRVRRRRRKYHDEGGDVEEAIDEPRPSSSHRRTPAQPRPKPSIESEVIRPTTPIPKTKDNITVTAPILDPEPHPVLLQPAVYNPSPSKRAPASPPRRKPVKTATIPAAPPADNGISAVQRNLEQEEAHRLMAEDAAARSSALQKAKAAVLSKLSREFCAARKSGRGGGPTRRPAAADAVAACRMMGGGLRDFGGVGGVCGSQVVLEDRRGLESQSVLVPLVFSRS